MSQPRDRPMQRTRLPSADLRAAWEQSASDFIAWARKPGHDSYWNFHRDLFLELVPAPGKRTLDFGCGEGRLSRDLKALGHGVELTMVSVHRPLQDYTEALATAGFLIERLREPRVPDDAIKAPRSRRWQRLPLFLHLRALKP